MRLTEEYEDEQRKSILNCNLVTSGTKSQSTNTTEDSDSVTLSIEENERVMLSLHELETLIPVRHWGDPLVDYCMESMINLVNVFTPSTRKQALRCEQADNWMNAERKEIESIISKKVLEGAVLPKGRKLLKTKWVYKIKHGADGEIKS